MPMLIVWFGACASDSKLDRVHKPPEAVILSPDAGALFRQGEGDVVVTASATDSYDPPTGLDASFAIDGGASTAVQLASDGTGTLAFADLAVGEHTVEFSVTDSDGESASASVAFVVGGPLGAPVVTILSPDDGTTTDPDTQLAFQGSATDTTTPADALVFSWTDSVQGELPGAISGGGSSAVFATLLAGTHVVTLTATDEDGESGSASVTVVVDTPIVEAEPGDLVFSELMIQPQVAADEVGEWVELYNTSGSPIDIGGYTFRDEDVDRYVLESGILVQPGDYVVLCASVDLTVNGGVPCDAGFVRDSSGGGMALANGTDEVVLSRPDGTDIDNLHYDATWIEPGVAIGVDPDWQRAGDNDDRSHWCLQTSVISTGGEPGTPGAANDDCDGM